jgi:hypothetical protein
VVVFDFYRSRVEIINQTTADVTLLLKLWQCVGLGGGDGGDEDGSEQDQSWKGVLTTLLACLGFAWHDDVDLLWDGDVNNIHLAVAGQIIAGRMAEVHNLMLLAASRVKHRELQGLAPYAAQLNAFLDARQQSAATEVHAMMWCWWCVSCRLSCGTHGRVTSSLPSIRFRSRRGGRW